jgi:aryl-alcohol dehydrogenase-like predicted oxidoreductase
MIYRKLGKSDVEISAITFGAWAVGGWMWGGTDEEQSIAAIRKAIELGITTIDTAAVYGFGRSEEIVAKAIAPYKRDDLQILTKFGLRWDITEPAPKRWDTTGRDGKPATISHWAKADGIIYECEQSLKRLNTDYIDVFQQHWPDPGTPVEESAVALTKLIEQGKIRAAGESNFPVELLDEISRQVPIASNQPPYSMVNRGIEDEVIPYCV